MDFVADFTTNRLQKDFTYRFLEVRLHYAHNTNCRKLDESARCYGERTANGTGHSVNELFGLVADGLFTEDDFVTNE